MKRTFSLLGGLFLGLFISISIIACGEDSLEAPDNNSSSAVISVDPMKVTKITFSGADESYTLMSNVNYDAKGRIASCKADDMSWNITISDTQITITITYEGDVSKYTITGENFDKQSANDINLLLLDFMFGEFM